MLLYYYNTNMGISMDIQKAVIVAAGWGTRLLPITKSIPKEMLPLINKPLIHYAVEEAKDSGLEQIIVVTAQGKGSLENYFHHNYELEEFLKKKNKWQLLKEMIDVAELSNIIYIRQKERKGLGHALLMLKEIIGHEPFAVLLPDDIIVGKTPLLKQMLNVYKKYSGSILAVEKVSVDKISQYGIIDPQSVEKCIHKVNKLIEKPVPEQAPSNLGIVGRYILSPQIFKAIELTPPDNHGEIQLTDALQILLENEEIYALEFTGKRFDTGDPLGLLKAQITLGLNHPLLKHDITSYLTSLLQKTRD